MRQQQWRLCSRRYPGPGGAPERIDSAQGAMEGGGSRKKELGDGWATGRGECSDNAPATCMQWLAQRARASCWRSICPGSVGAGGAINRPAPMEPHACDAVATWLKTRRATNKSDINGRNCFLMRL